MTNAEPTTYKIDVCLLDVLNAEIAHLNKKAAKLGSQPVVLNFHGEEIKKGKRYGIEFTRVFKIVSVTGETPKLAGWKLVAAVEMLESGENLVSCVPGETVPVEYRNTDTHCDHCKSDRRRKQVFILRNDDGRHAQVGRQCISDFLGGISPECVLAQVAWLLDIEKTMGECQDDEGYYGGGRADRGFNLEEFVKLTAAVIRKCGWVSRTVARERGEEGQMVATANIVTWLLTPSNRNQDQADKKEFIEKNNIDLEARDEKLALEAIAWAAELPTDQGDYQYNLGVAVRLGFVKKETNGLVASVIAAYQRHCDRQEELRVERETKVRLHLGTVGVRQGFAQVTIKAIKSFESDFGVKTLIRFETAEGSVLIWWKSGDTQWEKDQTLDITGTVKKHDDYKGTPQTILSRVAEGLPKVKKPRVKKAKAA